MAGLNAVLIVGAGSASAGLLGQLREDGFSGRVKVLAPELQPMDAAWENCEYTQARATGLDPSLGAVVAALPDGTNAEFVADHVVVVTGSVGSCLPGSAADVQTLTSPERLRLPCDGVADRRFVVVGAGMTGTEVASLLVEAGAVVTLLEQSDHPLEWLLGGHLGTDAVAWMRAAGVEVRLNTAAKDIAKTSAGLRVRTSVGDIECDDVVSAIGAVPNVDWLRGSIDIGAGVRCDAVGTALLGGIPVPRVHAIGECATWLAGDSEFYRGHRWPTSGVQGRIVARKLLGLPANETIVPDLPLCWSNQFGRLIQVVGRPTGDGTLVPVITRPELGKAFYAVRYAGGAFAWIAINAQSELLEHLGPLMHAPC